VVADETAAVHPGGPALDGHDAVGDAGEQFAVVADEQHGLPRVEQPFLEPPLAGDVEVVVRLVEQQHLVRPAQQSLECQPLLLTARQRGQLPVLAVVVRDTEGGDGHGVPGDLGLVPADVAPVGQGVRIRHLTALVVGLHQRQLRGLHRVPRLADGGRRQVDEEPLHVRVVADRADELAHHAEPAGTGDRARLRDQVTGDDAQQRRLAGPVLADQRRAGALPDAEADVVQEHPPVGKGVPDPADIDVAHRAIIRDAATGLPQEAQDRETRSR
jgi:hypothetical protein